MWRSPPPEYAELPQCRHSRRHWGTASTPQSPMPHTPKSPDRTLHPRLPPQQNRRCTGAPKAAPIASGGPGGRSPRGAAAPPPKGGGAAAKTPGQRAAVPMKRQRESFLRMYCALPCRNSCCAVCVQQAYFGGKPIAGGPKPRCFRRQKVV